jgi:hypothetical protein
VLKGPYGHPEVEVFSARRGRNVMSRGCGVKAAALAEVTAIAAAQTIDLIVNATMMCETEACRIGKNKPQHQRPATAVNIYISALHVSPTLSMAIGSTWCGDVVRQDVEDRGFLHSSPLRQAKPDLWPVGSMKAEFKLTSSEVEV